jgi:hypothetical protein
MLAPTSIGGKAPLLHCSIRHAAHVGVATFALSQPPLFPIIPHSFPIPAFHLTSIPGTHNFGLVLQAAVKSKMALMRFTWRVQMEA